jgi:hypothetical protein
MLKTWTIQRAATIGIATGIAAVLTVSGIAIWPEGLLRLYVALLAVTIFCGVSILWITASDIRDRGTSGRMRPIRAFDIAVGLALLIPAAYGLRLIWPELNL